MMNYELYRSFNLLQSNGIKKNIATRLFRMMRNYVVNEYEDPDSCRYHWEWFKSRHSEKFSYSTMQSWISMDYCKQYDDLLVDAIYNAPINDLYKIRGFGNLCEQALIILRNRKD